MRDLKSLLTVVMVTMLSVMIFGMAPVFAETDHGDCGQGVSWTLDDKGTLTINGNGKVEDYHETMESYQREINSPWYKHEKDIKKAVVGKGVTPGKCMFARLSYLESISCPEGIEEIPDGMCAYCTQLRTVSLPSSVKRIGASGFLSCKRLKSVLLPEQLTEIDVSAFEGSQALQHIDFPLTLERVGSHAFSVSGIDRVVIPAKTTEIDEMAFDGCPRLKHIIITSDQLTMGNAVFSNAERLQTCVIGDGVSSLPSETFSKAGKLYISPKVTSIADDALSGSYMTIYGEAGSAAEEFTRKNTLYYEPLTFYEVSNDITLEDYGFNLEDPLVLTQFMIKKYPNFEWLWTRLYNRYMTKHYENSL
ncbi:MAG: leucine-rich repeat domain-containing protein [Eubacteriaceae bacterium]|nr:leucine-rich repeat domain-containing protein [Eubacteriaceae bacterium]